MSSESGIGGQVKIEALMSPGATLFESSLYLQELSGDDVFEALHLPATSAIRAKLRAKGSTGSLLHRLISELKGMATQSPGSVDSNTQTDTVDTDGSPATIDSKLRRVDYQLSEAVEQERLVPLQTIEERMMKYQRECEERSRTEIQAEVARVREIEISRMRLEEAAKCRSQLDRAREELENLHLTRLKEMRAREAEMKERFATREQEIEKAAYNQRQRQIQDLEAMRARERDASRSEERGERMVALQEENLKQRMADLAAREAEINRAGERHELLVQETRNVVRRQMELEYTERLKALEAREKLQEQQMSQQTTLTNGHGSLTAQISDMTTEMNTLKHQLSTSEHKVGLLEADLAVYREDEGKKREEVERAGLALAQAREELTDAIKEAEHQRAVAKRLSAEAERVAQERSLSSEASEKRLQLERESRAREREAYIAELGVLKEEARSTLGLEQKRWANDREQYEQRERETHRAYLGMKEATEAEVSAHESTRARLEDTELQLRQARQEINNLRSLYEDAKNNFATASFRTDSKTQWPANPASFPKAPPPGYTMSKHTKRTESRGAPLTNLDVNPDLEQAKARKMALEQEEALLNKMQMERRLRMSTLGADSLGLAGGYGASADSPLKTKKTPDDSKLDLMRAELEVRDRAEAQIRATADKERQRIEKLEQQMATKLKESGEKEKQRIAQLEREMAQREQNAKEEMAAMHKKMSDLQQPDHLRADTTSARQESERVHEEEARARDTEAARETAEARRQTELAENARQQQEATDRALRQKEQSEQQAREEEKRKKAQALAEAQEEERKKTQALAEAEEEDRKRKTQAAEAEEKRKKAQAEAAAKAAEDAAAAQEVRRKAAADAVREAKERQEKADAEQRAREAEEDKDRETAAQRRDIRSPSPVENEEVEFSSSEEIEYDF